MNSSKSTATIRNTMADLSDEGYLYQPHTSAGRIPTDKAFQFYVKTLQARPAHNPRIVAELSEAGDVEDLISAQHRPGSLGRGSHRESPPRSSVSQPGSP